MTSQQPSPSGKFETYVFQTYLFVFFYFFMEWLFFATMPSVIAAMSWMDSLSALFVSPLFVVLPLSGIFLFLYLLKRFLPKAARGVTIFAAALSSFVLGCAWLILFDNFTYTVFGVGIKTQVYETRYLYTLALLAFVIWRSRWTLRDPQTLNLRVVVPAIAALYGISAIFLVASLLSSPINNPKFDTSSSERLAGLPNIFLIGIDGMSSKHMSAYGYQRRTTPFFEKLKDETLFVENAFSNHRQTFASITAMLTGRLPTETGVTVMPRILQQGDAYLHLPAILRSLQYYGIQETMRYWADAKDLNIQNSFHYANGRELGSSIFFGFAESGKLMYELLFFSRVGERISQRLLHLVGLITMENHFAHITPTSLKKYGQDHSRLKAVKEQLSQAKGPVFVHLHMLDTHCCYYKLKKRKFARSKRQILDDTDQYDDVLLSADKDVAKFYAWLKKEGYHENSVFVFYSDHGRKGSVLDRVPLMIRFPKQEFTGVVKKNIQSTDIAPTILEYLGMQTPSWMSGQSFLTEASRRRIADDRPIATVKENGFDQESLKPLLISSLAVLKCQTWYIFDGKLKFDRNIAADVDPSPGCEQYKEDPALVQAWVDRHMAKFVRPDRG